MKYKHLSRIRRVPLGEKIGRKPCLTDEEFRLLLSRPVVIEEKLDGTPADGKQFNSFVVFGEDLKDCHTIHYTRLPSYFIAFAVYDLKRKKFIDSKERDEFFQENGFFAPQLLYHGRLNPEELIDFLGRKSAYGDSYIEGIVIKNYNLQIFGKLISDEFFKGIKTHWRRKRIKKQNFLIKKFKEEE